MSKRKTRCRYNADPYIKAVVDLMTLNAWLTQTASKQCKVCQGINHDEGVS